MRINDNILISLLGPYAAAPDVLKERMEIAGYYNFYRGPVEKGDISLLVNKDIAGQSWLAGAADYEPTTHVRNHTKKLLDKQARFMFGHSPSLMFKPDDRGAKDKAEALRKFVDDVFEKCDFWSDTFKAFKDCTIGKRVLLVCIANPGEAVRFQYYTADQFTFRTDPKNYKKLEQVIIAYTVTEKDDKGNDVVRWYRWKYYMQNGFCWLEQGVYDELANPVVPVQNNNTTLTEIPARVVINGGLLGDLEGTSDVRELEDLAMDYNQTTSDFKDALKFRMFEQTVFTDVDPKSLKGLQIAPAAIIDLKTNPAVMDEGGRADAKMLSSSFSFVDAAREFLDRAKADMYELMDQPRPEDVKNVPSAKALKFTFYDLIARCEEKWLEWEPAIKWAIKTCLISIQQFNLYPDLWQSEWTTFKYSVVLQHNYPIPEDEDEQKKTAILEVQANVRSHKAYLKDFSDEEDAEGAWQEIIAEMTETTNAQADQFQTSLTGGGANPNGPGAGGANGFGQKGGGSTGNNNPNPQK